MGEYNGGGDYKVRQKNTIATSHMNFSSPGVHKVKTSKQRHGRTLVIAGQPSIYTELNFY